ISALFDLAGDFSHDRLGRRVVFLIEPRDAPRRPARVSTPLTAAAKSASFRRAPTLARRASPLYDVRSKPRLLLHRRSCRQLRRRDAPPPTPQPWENVLPVMSGKRAFLDLLKQEGVEIMFGNPGTTELPLMDAFATENELRYLLGLQEAAVMAMADGYA